jgi:hypothetical protein
MADGLTWAPGWFPDPIGRHDHRWWDGAAWTAHVADDGVAGLDAIDGPGLPSTPGPHRQRESRPDIPSRNDPVAVWALVVGLIALPVALFPGLGLVPAAAAVVLGLVARSRIGASRRAGDGVAIAGLVLGLVALLVALVVTVFSVILLSGSGGELAGAFREYVSCLDVRTESECRILLEESLARIVG